MTRSESEKFPLQERRFIFGATTAVITNMGLVTGLFFSPNAKMNIIGSILVIALADNISDSLGIHIFQEAEKLKIKEVWLSTLTNFFTRFLVSMFFVLAIAFMPIQQAVICLIILGMGLLAVISYFVARSQNRNPAVAIVEHIGIAILVILASHWVGEWILGHIIS
jgi:VIT1/CCC1 family predicted Fe2+/Mn2+ transporter